MWKKLKVACENSKILLSISEEATIKMYDIIENFDLIIQISRKEFEYECQHLFDKLYEPIENALEIAKEKKKNINEVILVGGSTRIPKIKEIIRLNFPKCKINDSINPDEVIAYGATIEAEKILRPQNYIIRNLSLLDVTLFSLGIEVKNNSTEPKIQEEGPLMKVIIKRGTNIPVKVSKIIETTYDNQTSIPINIYEGEKNILNIITHWKKVLLMT